MEASMKLRYSRVLAFVILGSGALCLLLNLWAGALAGFGEVWPGVATGAIISLVGVLYLNTPILVLTADAVTTYRPIGLVGARYPFASKTEITIERGRILVGGRKLSVPRWMADKRDWDAFVREIAA